MVLERERLWYKLVKSGITGKFYTLAYTSLAYGLYLEIGRMDAATPRIARVAKQVHRHLLNN